MALTLTLDNAEVPAVFDGLDPPDPDHLFRTGRIDFSEHYPNTGATVGEAFGADALGLSSVVVAIIEPVATYSFDYDYAAGALKVYDGAAQVADGTDLSAVTGVPFLMIGKLDR